jgi:hypothetical protein
LRALQLYRFLPAIIIVASTVAASCGPPADARLTGFRVDRGSVVAQYDDQTGRLRRLEVDTDRNGKVDTWTYMDGARIERIEIDRDENGALDRWEYYLDNRLEKIGTSTRGDGVVDEWAFQNAAGLLARVETDTDRDGRIDRWQSFEAPRAGAAPILRIVELDPDPSGHPTRRLRYDAQGQFDRAEAIGTSGATTK